jgi:hypothetical protein
MIIKKWMLTLAWVLVALMGKGQTVPVGMVGFDDQLKILQLQGKLGVEHSLMARPFFMNRTFGTDSLFRLIDSGSSYRPYLKSLFKDKGRFELLPFHFYTKFNSDRPYSWNQAGFLQAKGLQTLVSAGAHFSYGWLDVQLKPEFVYAANPSFPYNASYGAPTRGKYTKMFMGQSSVRVSKAGFSLGLSTENMWWGPGLHNSLLMSNNAPGFAHLTFNTTKPIKTPIGNFEFQLIGGKLVEDTSVLLENKDLRTTYYNPLTYTGDGYSGPNDLKRNWRYLSAVTLSYNPKWVKGLFLSVTRVGYAYKQNIDSNGVGNSFFQKYFPVLFGVLRKNYPYGTPTGAQGIAYKQMASFAARMVFPESHTEIYTEYGYGDNFLNLRDWNTDAPHATAYVIGIRKLKKLRRGQDWLDISVEMTKMSEPVNYVLRTAGDWYGYEGGYTNQSRHIGAGVGRGNNVYTAKLQWLSGFSRLGIIVQGIHHGPTAIVGGLLPDFGMRATKWNDFAVGVTGQHRFHKLILSAELQSVSTKHYAWEKGNNRFNLYGFLTATYLW